MAEVGQRLKMPDGAGRVRSVLVQVAVKEEDEAARLARRGQQEIRVFLVVFILVEEQTDKRDGARRAHRSRQRLRLFALALLAGRLSPKELAAFRWSKNLIVQLFNVDRRLEKKVSDRARQALVRGFTVWVGKRASLIFTIDERAEPRAHDWKWPGGLSLPAYLKLALLAHYAFTSSFGVIARMAVRPVM